MSALKQTLGDFKSGVVDKVAQSGRDLSRAEINSVFDAIVLQAQEDLRGGYEVPLFGLAKIIPAAKKGRKKGTEVRNPFDGTTRKLDATEPDSIKLKAKPMAASKSAVPEAGTSEAKSLVKALS